jgi:molybdate transport repressor ModE-like protein
MPDQGDVDWDDFRFVLAILRTGTVSAAARQLGVDHTTVIRRIDRLERLLSAKLFDRRKTGYVLTDAGHSIATHAEAIEAAVVASQNEIGGSRARLTGTVRIGAPDGFGTHFLAPRLTALAERYPDLEVELVATARLFSLSKREADIAISLTQPTTGSVVGRKLTDYSLGLFAAPDYLSRHSPVTSRDNLAGHRFIGYIAELLYTPELDYLPLISPRIAPSLRSANLIAQFNATLSGYGIAVLPHFMAADDPRLVAVLPESIVIRRSFFLLMHADSKDLARIRAVADMIHCLVDAERERFDPR